MVKIRTGQIGTAGDAWQTWTPTFTNITVGNGTVTGKYIQIGKTVFGLATFQTGSTTSYGATGYQISLPVNASANSGGFFQGAGTWTVYDRAGAIAYGLGFLQFEQVTNPTFAYLYYTQTSTALSGPNRLLGAASGNFAPSVTGSGSFFEFKFSYEAA